MLRCHHRHVVAQLDQLTGPVMRAAAGFQADAARRQWGHNGKDLGSRYPLGEPDLALCINPMKLKNIL